MNNWYIGFWHIRPFYILQTFNNTTGFVCKTVSLICCITFCMIRNCSKRNAGQKVTSVTYETKRASRIRASASPEAHHIEFQLPECSPNSENWKKWSGMLHKAVLIYKMSFSRRHTHTCILKQYKQIFMVQYMADKTSWAPQSNDSGGFTKVKNVFGTAFGYFDSLLKLLHWTFHETPHRGICGG